MEPRFAILTLGVNDLETSLKFYRDGLGFPSKGIIGTEYPRGAVALFDLKNGMILSIYPRNDLAWDANISESAPAPTEFSIGYNVKTKEEVEAILELARKAGATITKPASEAFWGGYSGYFQDPDGHLWEILWNPHYLPTD